MLWLWNFFLEKRQFSYVLIGTLIIAGLYALIALPKENTPEINIPYAIVSATLPGAAAEDMETLVTNKLEDQVSNVSNVSTVTSSSGEGLSVVTVQFNANADSKQAMQDLRDAVAKATPELPADASTPSVTQLNFSDAPIIVVSVAGNLPPSEFYKLSKEVSDKLTNIQGVSKVNISGVPEREVNVVVSKESLEQFGLRLTDVIGAISASNAALPAGNITLNGVNYSVNFKGSITDSAEIANIAVGTKGGVPIYLRDISTVFDGLAPATSYSRVSINGTPSTQAVTFNVYKQAGASIQGTANKVRATFEELETTTLRDLTVLISPSTDQGVQVATQLGELTKVGFETVALVILALLLTIGWRESLVAALSIPLSFLIAFIGLYLTGNTLNFISLFALILAVGILVDSGIVVTEAIHARMRLYKTPTEAARAALHDYAWPLIAGTMATVAVFAPLFFISGIIGKFIAGIPYTLIFVLIASIIVALGMVPLIAILFTKKAPNRLEVKQEEYTDKVTHWYKKRLHQLLENTRIQKIFLRSLAAMFVVSLLLPITGLLTATFFPQEDLDFVYINVQKPQGTTLAQTDLTARAVEEILYANKDIASLEITVGQSSALSGAGSSGSNLANFTVNLPEHRKKSSTQILNELTRELAPITDATIQVLQPNNGPSAGAPVQIQFIGEDLDSLIIAAERGKQLLASIPHTINVAASTQNSGTAFELTIDRAKATALGLNTSVVAQTLRAAINGTTATTIRQPGEDIDVNVKLNLNAAYTDPSNTTETTLDSIKNLTIQGANGPVLLGAVLKDSLGQSNASIAHKDKKRLETISAYPDDKTTATDIVSAFQKRANEINLPPGVVISYGGETEDINQSFTEMLLALVAGLVLMFMILIVAFNSIRYTLQLLLIVPLSLVGVLDGLALTGQPLSFPSMLGFIALGGVIINHAIILMDSMIEQLRTAGDKPLIDVVVDASATRLRPIVLTTITTVIGMVPLVLANPFWAPLALSVMFGLSFAIILTLIVVPVRFYRSVVKERAKQSK